MVEVYSLKWTHLGSQGHVAEERKDVCDKGSRQVPSFAEEQELYGKSGTNRTPSSGQTASRTYFAVLDVSGQLQSLYVSFSRAITIVIDWL